MFFFSDANLQKDHYLLSLMDEEGWVSINKIADFNRVCSLYNVALYLFYVMECLIINGCAAIKVCAPN